MRLLRFTTFLLHLPPLVNVAASPTPSFGGVTELKRQAIDEPANYEDACNVGWCSIMGA